MNKHLAYIPSNLNLQKLLADNPPPFIHNIDNFRYILHLITSIPAYNKDMLDENNGYTLIHALTLKKIVHNYYQYIDYLLHYEILDTDNIFIPNEKSLGFRFTPFYASSKCKFVELTYYCLIRNINKWRRENEAPLKNYRHLQKYFNNNLKFDYDAALDFLNEQKLLDEQTGNFSIQKYNCRLYCFENFHNQNFRFKVDNTSFRLHTNLTNLPKEFRKFVTYNGQTLVSSDIKNSQPFFVLSLNSDNFYGKAEGLRLNYSRDLRKKVEKRVGGIENRDYIMLLKSVKSFYGKDFQKFAKDVQDGRFYEEIQDHLKIKYNIDLDRDTIKKKVLHAFYSHNLRVSPSAKALRTKINEAYPDVFSMIFELKRDEYKFFPRLLQTIESTIVLERITRRIAKENPNLPIFTIHDSIVTTLGNEHYVKSVMMEEITAAVGFIPRLEEEYWEHKEHPNTIHLLQPNAQLQKAS